MEENVGVFLRRSVRRDKADFSTDVFGDRSKIIQRTRFAIIDSNVALQEYLTKNCPNIFGIIS